MIPTEVQELILEAWEGVLPRLLKDPDELAVRLGRRRKAILARPWRPFCLAVRAADTRIDPYWFVVTPEHAVELDDPRHPYEYIEHEVTLTTERLKMLLRPVKIGAPGEPAFEVAKKLGWDYCTFSLAMRRPIKHHTAGSHRKPRWSCDCSSGRSCWATVRPSACRIRGPWVRGLRRGGISGSRPGR
jgi:hypothetical protein